jgi:hypothetical protein
VISGSWMIERSESGSGLRDQYAKEPVLLGHLVTGATTLYGHPRAGSRQRPGVQIAAPLFEFRVDGPDAVDAFYDPFAYAA